jgi:putative hydrolase of the HAD superfamily
VTPEEAILIKRIQELNAPMDPSPADITPRLERLSGLRAILFDIYGTLLVSNAGAASDNNLAGRAVAFQSALNALNCDINYQTAVSGVNLFNEALASEHAAHQASGIEYPEADIQTVWIKVLRELRRQSAISQDITDKVAARLAIEYENRINPVWPMPDAEYVLSTLSAKGWLLGIVSNAQFYTTLTLTALLGEKWKTWFSPSLCFWSHEYNEAKPGQYLYRRAAAALLEFHAIRPQEVAMIGNDVEHDIKPALDCGFRAILFAGDRRACRLGTASRKNASSWPWLTMTNWQQLMDITGPLL